VTDGALQGRLSVSSEPVGGADTCPTQTGDVAADDSAATIVDANVERELIVSVLMALGVPATEAAAQADQLVEADVRGHQSHGLQRLSMIVRRIHNGMIVPGAHPTHTWRTPSFVRVVGGRGLGPVVAWGAVEEISARACEVGVAVAAISDSNHLGMLAPYVERLARRGQVGLAMTTSEALVHAHGGRRALIGTNPIAIAVPARPDPFVLDMATGEVSMGRILAHLHREEPIPLGWAIDEYGERTTDPAAAATGAISPFGGAKGYALGLAVELLVAALTESALGRDVHGTLDATDICNKGDLFLCADLKAIHVGDPIEATSAYLQQIRDSGTEAHTPVSVPGDRSRALREQRMRAGVPIATAVWKDAEALRRELVDTSR
jgi:L-2-hydroxycarboxylate dehydrogenase (NAD+)